MLSKKHIKVPKTHDPGLGRPKEHLAYINRAEAELLRQLTDGTVEKGPKGIPSYASFAGTSGTGYASGYKGSSAPASRPAASRSSVNGVGSAAKSGSSAMSSAARSAPSVSRGGSTGGGFANTSSGGARDSGQAASRSAPASKGVGATAASAASKAQSSAARSVPAAQGARSPSAASPAPSKSPGVGTTSRGPNAAAAAAANRLASISAPSAPSVPSTRPPGSAMAATKDSQQKAASAVAAPSAADLARRASAVSRGPGVLTGYRPEAIARTVAFGESPAGVRAPALAADLRKAALNNQQLFSMSGATPEQQALLGQIGSSALHVAMRTGLDPRTVLGQAMTESTTGKHDSKVSALARKSNNLFGIKGWGKTGENWDGSVVRMPTKEVYGGKTVTVREPFRTYATPNQSVLDYGNLIERRYSGAADAETVEGQLARIRGGGYATHAPSSYVRMGVRNANRLSVGGDDASGTQLANPTTRPTGGFQTAAATAPQIPAGPVPRPVPRPWTAPPKPNPRPWGEAPIPRARPEVQGPPRPLAGDPRVSMAPGSYPARAVPVPTARPPVQGPPRPMSGDPRVSMPPGSYPAAERMDSQVMTDPRTAMPPGRYPAAPPVKDRSRVPAVSIAMTDPRVNLPPGSYPAAAAPARGLPLRGIDGLTELPPGYAERYGLGPKPQKPAEKPAKDKDTGGWLQAGFDVVQEKVGEAKQAVVEKQQELKEAVDTYGQDAVLAYLEQKAGISKQSKFPERSRESGVPVKKRRRIALPPSETVAAPAQPAAQPDMSYFTNVTSREEALRRLLGEGWYA